MRKYKPGDIVRQGKFTPVMTVWILKSGRTTFTSYRNIFLEDQELFTVLDVESHHSLTKVLDENNEACYLYHSSIEAIS